MSDLEKILWTSAGTLAGGVVLFALSQFVTELVIKPYLRFRGILEEISSTIIYRSGVLCSLAWKDAPEVHREVHHEVRKLAGKLRAAAIQIPFYEAFVVAGSVPSREKVKEAAGLLIRLSNMTGDTESYALRYEDVGR